MDTYYGHVRSPADAIKLFEACRLGLLPRVQRRLSEKERQSIKSGSVFVWDEREAGMRRWTDGKSWSASRVSGSFLTYREMEGKRGGGQFVPPPVRRPNGKTPDSARGSDEDLDLDGEGPDGYRYKPDGLMKQSFSITTSTGQHLHLISYYSRPHPGVPDLPTPTTDPQLRHINPVKGMYPESTVHEAQGPAVTRTPMQQSPYLQHQPILSPHRVHPPPPYGYQAGYSWPPSPAQTPPYPHFQGPIYSSLPPPPGSAHTSPYSHHSPHLSNGHMPAIMPHPHQQTSFDRPPPALSDASLPPPPSSRGMSTATAANLMPSYVANPSPRVAQARLVAEQQAQIAQRALQAPQILDPRLTTPISLPPVQIPRTVTPPQTTQTPVQPQPHARLRSPSPNARPETPKTNGAAPAQSIPSISSLVHATDSVCVMSDNKSNSNGKVTVQVNSNGGSSRHGSNSPQAGGPNDIPHDKLNIGGVGEDQRAIRVLDKKFMI
ncbi:hypothetical protein QTJ16_004481 [Diplocarpon rosae]|uniref:cAMP-independent regulatory protein pac2 n=1 Tax=Diplocarpon rosae TaxID=946125 RepID=A0AAD9T018_9HELO|nr:hypothetical protein QTJ16_004481 [Diplocarpon rosae]PBP19824.1 hypothetical protein BUE80_DR009317 [Diplocarpon rosae]